MTLGWRGVAKVAVPPPLIAHTGKRVEKRLLRHPAPPRLESGGSVGSRSVLAEVRVTCICLRDLGQADRQLPSATVRRCLPPRARLVLSALLVAWPAALAWRTLARERATLASPGTTSLGGVTAGLAAVRGCQGVSTTVNSCCRSCSTTRAATVKRCQPVSTPGLVRAQRSSSEHEP